MSNLVNLDSYVQPTYKIHILEKLAASFEDDSERLEEDMDNYEGEDTSEQDQVQGKHNKEQGRSSFSGFTIKSNEKRLTYLIAQFS